jgi:molecular chaperone DnaJ
MAKNYYHILGLKSDASDKEIKEAYRRKAKEYHPDHYGSNRIPFQEIQEAFMVLGNPDKRCDYDRTVQEKQTSAASQKRSPDLSSSQRHYHRSYPDDFFLEGIFESPLSLFDMMFNRLHSDFMDWEFLPERRSIMREVEIILSPREASQGGSLRLAVPATVTCANCRGRGWEGNFICSACGGSGSLRVDKPITIDYPAGIKNNSSLRISPDRLGIPEVSLQVYFKIGS